MNECCSRTIKHKLSDFNLKRPKKVTQICLDGMGKNFESTVIANLYSFWEDKE